MDYEKIYTDFYSSNYDRFEEFIKRYWIQQKNDGRTFGYAIKNVNECLANNFKEKYSFSAYRELDHLYQLFQSRFSLYDYAYATQGILATEIKTGYNKIETSQLPANYNYTKFIKDIALFEVEREISRLLSVNSQYLPLFYDLDEFEDFEIRDHKGLCIEDYPVYKKLYKKKLSATNARRLESEEQTMPTQIDKSAADSDNHDFAQYAFLFKSEVIFIAFLTYQKHIIDSYIDFSYLKKRMQHEQLIHNHTDSDFMTIIFKSLKLINEKQFQEYNIKGKLKSLAKSSSAQRENNFNNIFGL